MRVVELARLVSFCPYTIKRWIKAGKISATRIKPEWGGHWYWDISQEQLAEYLEGLNK